MAYCEIHKYTYPDNEVCIDCKASREELDYKGITFKDEET
jgi:hypothetical protein